MKKISIFFCLSCLIATAQGQDRTIVPEWRYDISDEKIYISYDLDKQGIFTYYDISIGVNFFSTDLQIVSTAVSGDIGPKIRWGKNKTIVLDIFEVAAKVDYNGTITVHAKPVPIEQIDPEDICPKTDYYIAGGSLAVGAGLITVGLANFFSKDIKTYRDDCDPDSETVVENMFFIDSETGQSPCDESYDLANRRYKRGQILGGLGLLAAGVGAYFLVRKPILIKCEKNKENGKEGTFLSVSPEGGFAGVRSGGRPGFSVGLKIGYRF